MHYSGHRRGCGFDIVRTYAIMESVMRRTEAEIQPLRDRARMLIGRKTTREIARDLGVSERTVTRWKRQIEEVRHAR